MEDVGQQVMELQSAAPAIIEETAASAVKSILFYVHEDDALEARLQTALSLARSCSAHLQLLHVTSIQAYTVVDAYGSYVSGQIVEALEEEASNLKSRLEEHLGKEDVSWSYEETRSACVPELLRNAALSDLVVIGRQPPFHEFGPTGPGLLGELVCSTRTPLCIPGDEARSFDPFGGAVIAWNGSIEGANAVRSTIGLLRMASDVRVIRFTEDKEPVLAGTRLLEYLSRHGVHAEIETHATTADPGGDLVDYASRKRAEYIVMGGYSHSRAGEFLFGGVTRELLHECRVSLVMAH